MTTVDLSDPSHAGCRRSAERSPATCRLPAATTAPFGWSCSVDRVDLPFVHPDGQDRTGTRLQQNRGTGRRGRSSTPGCRTTSTRPARDRRPTARTATTSGTPQQGPASAPSPSSPSTRPHPATMEKDAITADGSLVYASADRLYVATVADGWSAGGRTQTSAARPAAPSTPSPSTQATTTYVASGEVDGVVPDRWALQRARRPAARREHARAELESDETAVTVLREEPRSADSDRRGRRVGRARADHCCALVRRPGRRRHLPADRSAVHPGSERPDGARE